jgi:hypothetical protein
VKQRTAPRFDTTRRRTIAPTIAERARTPKHKQETETNKTKKRTKKKTKKQQHAATRLQVEKRRALAAVREQTKADHHHRAVARLAAFAQIARQRDGTSK